MIVPDGSGTFVRQDICYIPDAKNYILKILFRSARGISQDSNFSGARNGIFQLCGSMPCLLTRWLLESPVPWAGIILSAQTSYTVFRDFDILGSSPIQDTHVKSQTISLLYAFPSISHHTLLFPFRRWSINPFITIHRSGADKSYFSPMVLMPIDGE